MFSLISFLFAILMMMALVAIACKYMKAVTLNWGKYVLCLVTMFLWFDDLIGSMGALSFVTIGIIPLFISVFVFKNPTNKPSK